jgi:hypothetical protein
MRQLEVCDGCQAYHLDRAIDGRMHCRYCEPEAFERPRPPAHYNPVPKFGLRVEWPEMFNPDEGDDLEWCIDCGDTFRYDDCGGYNPPCACGLHCRSCHDAEESRGVYDDADYDDDRAEYEERVIREVYGNNGY